MSSDERRDAFGPDDARGRIGTALDEIAPSPAPVAAVIRRGKRIRFRRRAGVIAGLAAVGVAVAVAPGLTHDTSRYRPPVPLIKPPQVTIGRVGPHGPPGLIAKGAINDRTWTIRLGRMGKKLCIEASEGPGMACQTPSEYRTSGAPASLQGGGDQHRYFLAGPVAARVRQVRFVLSDGAVLRAGSVRYGQQRWIGVEMPTRLRITEAIAYSAAGEVGHAIPFYNSPVAVPTFVTWQRPGQTGQPRITRRIGSGISAGERWRVTEHTGPWGYCLTVLVGGQSPGTECTVRFSRQGNGMMSSSDSSSTTGKLPWWFVGAVPNSVRSLKFAISDGRTISVPAVTVGGESFYSFALGRTGLRVVGWDAYNGSGRRVSGGHGLP